MNSARNSNCSMDNCRNDLDSKISETSETGGSFTNIELKTIAKSKGFVKFDNEDTPINTQIDLSFVENLSRNSTRKWRWKVGRIVHSFPVTLLISLFVIIDIILIIVDISINGIGGSDQSDLPRDLNFKIADLFFSIFLFLDLLLCLFAFGWNSYLKEWLTAIDALINTVTFTLSLLDVILEDTALINTLKVVQVIRFVRVFRFIRIIRIYTFKKRLSTSARQMVSQNKRRYQKDGFDLDLTYVTDRIIATSYPSSGYISLYRNPIAEVVRFLDLKHADHYKVYNLCSEKFYDPSHFHGRVERYEIVDHNVPTFKQMMDFAESVRCWLEADEENIIVVHCKGGKGRTGTMICVWLVEAGLFSSASDSLDYFGARRTDTRVGRTFQGVETPSQSRYVGYYELIKDNGGLIPPTKELKLKSMRIHGISRVGNGDGSDLCLEIFANHKAVPLFRVEWGHPKLCQVLHHPQTDSVECVFPQLLQFQGDIQFVVRSKLNAWKVPRGYLNAAFYFWFNTAFVEGKTFRLERQDLDNPHKSKTWKCFGDNFAVELEFA